MYCGQLGIDEAVYNYGNNVLENLKERFEAIDEVAEYNQLKVIAAMQKNRVAEMHCIFCNDDKTSAAFLPNRDSLNTST